MTMPQKEILSNKLLLSVIGLLVIVIFLLLGWKVSKIQFLGIELVPPATPSPYANTDFQAPFNANVTEIPHTLVIGTPTSSNSLSENSYKYNQDDIDAVIGKGYWRCINGSPLSISIDRIPNNYVVAFPFSRIDTKGNFYSIGKGVPGGDMGTGWLISDLPNSSCASEKEKVDSQIINAFFGKGAWVCVENSQPSGINLYILSEGFSIQRPITFIDYDGKRYYQGDRLPVISSGSFMRVWFESEIPRNECP